MLYYNITNFIIGGGKKIMKKGRDKKIRLVLTGTICGLLITTAFSAIVVSSPGVVVIFFDDFVIEIHDFQTQ